MATPRIEIVFRKGLPVAAFLHLIEGNGKSNRTINFRPSMTAHYDGRGLPIGLELVFPVTVTLQQLNEALNELGQGPLPAADFAALTQM